jgi:hypothetical protein
MDRIEDLILSSILSLEFCSGIVIVCSMAGPFGLLLISTYVIFVPPSRVERTDEADRVEKGPGAQPQRG